MRSGCHHVIYFHAHAWHHCRADGTSQCTSQSVSSSLQACDEDRRWALLQGKQEKKGARTNRGLFGGSTAAAEQEQQPAVKEKKHLRRSGRTSAAPKELTPVPSQAPAKQKQQKQKHDAVGPSKQRAGKAKQPASAAKAGKGAGSGKLRRRVLPCVERDEGEEVLRVGDSVYVVLDESCLALLR